MSRLSSVWAVVVAGLVAGPSLVFQVQAQPAQPPSPFQALNANTLPPVPYIKSPVDLFRDLLAMSPVERKNSLTNRPPQTRARILEKLREYEMLDANERELRLTATELHWYLPPLMRATPEDRAARLVTIPPGMRKLVKDRLEQWDILPPSIQQELTDNEQTLRFFTHVEAGPQDYSRRNSTNHYSWENELARWNALPEEKRLALSEQFTRFFDLTSTEKTKTLNTLSDAERGQMERTLQAFEKLPAAERTKCIRSFEQFSSMTSQERFQFLKSAERWSRIPPEERQAWRDLVARVPQWPPMPPGFNDPGLPPLPPTPKGKTSKARPGVDLVNNTN